MIKSQNEFETKAVTCNHGWCHVIRTFRKSKFHEMLKLVGHSAPKMLNFIVGAISMPYGAHVYYYCIILGVALSKSNTGSVDVGPKLT